MPLADLNLGPLVTVAQATNISTAVTANGRYFQIATQAMDAAAGAENSFTLNNTFITATSIVLISFATASGGTPMMQAVSTAAGSCTILITNLHGANALDAAATITGIVL